MKTHLDLDVWKFSMDFVVNLYRITDSFPKEERFSLVTQLRRAGVSVCSNIAEGAARHYPKEYIQFLYISLGSVAEIETQLEIAFRLGYLESIEQEKDNLNRIRRMLLGIIRQKTISKDS